jgi:hypothetical protein
MAFHQYYSLKNAFFFYVAPSSEWIIVTLKMEGTSASETSILTNLHSGSSQKTAVPIVIAMKTSNPIQYHLLLDIYFIL